MAAELDSRVEADAQNAHCFANCGKELRGCSQMKENLATFLAVSFIVGFNLAWLGWVVSIQIFAIIGLLLMAPLCFYAVIVATVSELCGRLNR